MLTTCSNSTFFPVKRLKASVWKTKDIIIGGKNPRDINFAYISNQVQFIDTIKYFQQSLGALASSLTMSEKSAIYSECQKYLMADDRLSRTFLVLSITDRDWVLNYSSSRKGTIPYEMISDFDFLNISPDKDFFEFHQFYSNMKDTVRSEEEYENVKKLYKLMKMSNLGELNKIYNFQEIIILCELFEQRSDLLKKMFKFNQRRCSSASSFSGCVHCNKSKCCIALPTDADFVRLFEKTLIGGFSCVKTRLAYDTNILLKDTDKGKVLIEININGKKQLKRLSSKILKMDENNQTINMA